MKSTRTTKQQTEDIINGLLQKVAQNKATLSKNSTSAIKKAYYGFSKAPIDTGESQRQSAAILTIGKTILVDTKIDTNYAKFFAFGLGSNRKYGERNPLKAAEDDIVKLIINTLR